jgi:23S rRNA (cytidine1920-2'-O)/16S rRNA (cytidine1409-2'-O)-methyltransferase
LKGERLDERVVREGLAPSRSAAQALILAGRVLVDDEPRDKSGTRIAPERIVRVKGGLRRFVSRGGEKLAAALEDLALDPAGRRCLDVGHGQIHSGLRLDPRVDVRERVNARHLRPTDFDHAFDLVVADVSFISLELILPAMHACGPAAELVLLVKPQFEVGREQVGKGGVVRDDALREGAADGVVQAACALGRQELGRVECRLAGPKGNREIFVWISGSEVEE